MLPVLVAKLHRSVVTARIECETRGIKNFNSRRHRVKVV